MYFKMSSENKKIFLCEYKIIITPEVIKNIFK